MLLFKVELIGVPIYNVGIVALYFAAALTLWSMFDYLTAAFKPQTVE